MKIHRITGGPWPILDYDDLLMITAMVEDSEGGYEEREIYAPFKTVYNITTHMQKPTIEPYEIEFEEG